MSGNKKNKGLSVIVILLAVILIAVVGYFAYSYISKDINGNDGTDKDYTLVIESSDFQYDVSQKLYQNGIVLNDSLWSSWMDRHYPDFIYINGEYALNSSMSYEEIAAKLQNPDISHKTVSVCIPEGYNVFQIADTMEENGICSAESFLSACKDKSAYSYDFLDSIPSDDKIAYQLEGFLFPATYDIGENSDAHSVVSTMLDAFELRITSQWTDYCTANNMSLYELVTLASVVEEETLGQGVAENIASVFINRLEKGQKLQSDVTIFYGNELRSHGFSDTVVESYNTYKCQALPSGPVTNPGVANIDAVVNHNDTDYFYFFSYNNGADFFFTADYNEFQSRWVELGSTNTE